MLSLPEVSIVSAIRWGESRGNMAVKFVVKLDSEMFEKLSWPSEPDADGGGGGAISPG